MRTFLRSISPTYFAFLGAISISAAVNSYTSIICNVQAPPRWTFLALAAVLLVIAGLSWTVLSVWLGDVQQLVKSAPSVLKDDEVRRTWNDAYARHRVRLLISFWIATATLLAGLYSMSLGPIQSTQIKQLSARSDDAVPNCGEGTMVVPSLPFNPMPQVTDDDRRILPAPAALDMIGPPIPATEVESAGDKK